jgi:hypothetical protein
MNNLTRKTLIIILFILASYFYPQSMNILTFPILPPNAHKCPTLISAYNPTDSRQIIELKRVPNGKNTYKTALYLDFSPKTEKRL